MEQRANIKFCYKLGKTAMETSGVLVQVYGREAVSRKCVYEWFKCFREGKERLRITHVQVAHKQAENQK